jgi:hypothetical protein
MSEDISKKEDEEYSKLLEYHKDFSNQRKQNMLQHDIVILILNLLALTKLLNNQTKTLLAKLNIVLLSIPILLLVLGLLLSQIFWNTIVYRLVENYNKRDDLDKTFNTIFVGKINYMINYSIGAITLAGLIMFIILQIV